MASSKGLLVLTQVPLLDLRAQYAALKEPIEAAIREVCDSQQFVLGPRVGELERHIADYSGAAFGIGVSSGTDALLLALMALGIGPGDEVITTPYTFFATAGAIARVGARPVFCDIDETSFNLSPAAVDRFISENCERSGRALINRATRGRIKAVIPVHLYGRMADMDALLRIAAEHDLNVVEDAAQAIGAELPDGRRAGSLGHIGCFSFFPTKNLGAFGDAGMCVTNDPALAERMRILRVHGGEPKYFHAVIGGNFRLDELQAAVLLIKFQALDEWTAARQRNAAYYTEQFLAAGLSNDIETPETGDGRHIFNQYVIRAAQRDRLREALGAAEIGTEIYYPLSLDQQACFAYLQYGPDDFPASHRAAAETLALPVFPELHRKQQEHVVQSIRGFYRA